MRREGHDLKLLAVIYVSALAARVIPVLFTLDTGIALDDMFQYDALAESIRWGRGYTWYGGIPTAARAPLYPLFLAVIYFLFGHSFFAARIAQAVLASFLPLIVYLLGRRLFDRRVAVGAAWVLVFYPLFMLYPLGLITENLFFLLVPLTVLCLFKAIDTSRNSYYALAGLLLGLCILTRSVISGLVLLILPWLWYCLSDIRAALKKWGLILLPVAALTVPWSIRNSLLYGQFVFVESSLGFNFYLGYHPSGTGTFDSPIAVDFLEEIGGFDSPGLETERLAHNLGMERGLRFIGERPLRALWLMGSKLSHFLRLDKRAVLYFYSNNFLGELPTLVLLVILLVICLPWVFVALLSVLGMSFAEVTRDKVLIYLLFFYYIGVHMLIMSEPRFHLALVPFLAIFAVQGGVTLPRLRGQLQTSDVAVRRAAGWRLAWCLLAMGLLVLNWAYEIHVDMDKLRVIFSAGGNTARFTY